MINEFEEMFKRAESKWRLYDNSVCHAINNRIKSSEFDNSNFYEFSKGFIFSEIHRNKEAEAPQARIRQVEDAWGDDRADLNEELLRLEKNAKILKTTISCWKTQLDLALEDNKNLSNRVKKREDVILKQGEQIMRFAECILKAKEVVSEEGDWGSYEELLCDEELNTITEAKNLLKNKGE